MSWRASAHVKPLTNHADGSPLTAREKLILFVLADCHNDDHGCAWPSLDTASAQALTSRRRFIELIKRLEERGTLLVERREGRSNLYRFPGLVQSSHPTMPKGVQKLHGGSAAATALGSAIATAPKPLENLHITDIPPDAADIHQINQQIKAAEATAKARFMEKFKQYRQRTA